MINHRKFVFTDSGLGGLASLSTFIERLKKGSPYQSVDLVYFNALPHRKWGYNQIKSPLEKIKIFNRVLYSMESHFEPDGIAIACNTLSVLTHQTSYRKKMITEMVDTVAMGVQLMETALTTHPQGQLAILGTPTTISSKLFLKKLKQLGFRQEQIIEEPCPRLHKLIESNPMGLATKNEIRKHLTQIRCSLRDQNTPLILSLNCTHYYFIKNLIWQLAKELKLSLIDVLEPSTKMLDFAFHNRELKEKPQINVQVFTRVRFDKKELKTAINVTKDLSPELATAIANQTVHPYLFDWQI